MPSISLALAGPSGRAAVDADPTAARDRSRLRPEEAPRWDARFCAPCLAHHENRLRAEPARARPRKRWFLAARVLAIAPDDPIVGGGSAKATFVPDPVFWRKRSTPTRLSGPVS